MKVKFLSAIAIILGILTACDDNTPGIGQSIYNNEKIDAYSDAYDVQLNTIRLDSVYAQNSQAYLGRFSDPVYGHFSADFITQINWTEGTKIPSNLCSIDSVALILYHNGHYGDSLATLKVQVDTLNQQIVDNGIDKSLYYTTFNPTKFYNPSALPIAQKIFAPTDLSVSDSIRASSDYYPNLRLNFDNQFGKYLFEKYQENPSNFRDSYTFSKGVLKGFYVHITQGEGAIVYIGATALRMRLGYKTKSSAGKDSVAYTYLTMAGTREVYMSTRFSSPHITDLLDENKAYLRTPAGLCSEIELTGLQQMYDKHKTDSLNFASLNILKYRDASSEIKTQNPKYVLLLRKKELYTFFENNKLADNSTSFLGTYSSTTNGYTFNKLNRLISVLFHEIRANNGVVPNEKDFNKFVLIPVTVQTDAQSNIINISNDLEVTNAVLEKNLKLNLIFSQH